MFIGLLAAAAATGTVPTPPNVRVVRLTTPDDIGIMGTYYPVEGDSVPAVVLVHGLGRTRDEWAGFAALVQQRMIAALAIDLRGHGESTRRLTALGPVVVDYRTFTPRDFENMVIDVNTAVDWLMDQPGIDRRRIAVLGASLGANVALRYAPYNDDLAAIGLLSPGITYRGVRTDDVIGKLGNESVLIVVSRNDPVAYESSKRLNELRIEAGHTNATNDLIVCSGSLHGGDMIRGVKGLPGRLLSWLEQVLRGITPPAAVAEPPQAPTPPAASKRPPGK